MMATRNLLYKTECPINDFISVQIPTVDKVLESEDDYYSLITTLTAMPIDMMVQLDDVGIDFATIDQWELFLILFGAIKEHNTSLIFGSLDLASFSPALSGENGHRILSNPSGINIDRAIHRQIVLTLRKIHHIEQNDRKPANGEAKEYMMLRAREKIRRNKNKTLDSQLEKLIVALVNTEQFHYGFDEVRKLSIYQFNKSLRQIIKKVNYDNIMHGVYSGTVSAKDLSQDDLSWLTNK